MFLGVPCLAVITGLMEDAVDKRLQEKDIDLPVLKNEKTKKSNPVKSTNKK